MMIKLSIFLSILLVILSLLTACSQDQSQNKNQKQNQKQNQNQSWQNTYGSEDNDGFRDILELKDGYILVGYTGVSPDREKGYLLKINKTGREQWSRIIDQAAMGRLNSLIEYDQESFLLSGMIKAEGAIDTDAYLALANVEGKIIWEKKYGDDYDQEFYQLIKGSDESFLLVGYAGSYAGSNKDGYILKINQQGQLIWQTLINGSGLDELYDIKELRDKSGYLIVGLTDSWGKGDYDGLLVKINQHGQRIWQKTFGSIGEDRFFALEETDDGGYFLVGSSQFHCYIVKIDEQGEEIWEKTYRQLQIGNFLNIVRNKAGEYILSGFIQVEEEQGAAINLDGYLSKIDDSGNEIWSKSIGGPEWEKFFNIVVHDQGYLLIGETNSSGKGKQEGFVVRIKEDNKGELIIF